MEMKILDWIKERRNQRLREKCIVLTKGDILWAMHCCRFVKTGKLPSEAMDAD